MQLRTWAEIFPWNLSVLATKKKVLVLAPKCLMHLRVENRHPRLPEKLSVLQLVFVLVRWEFQGQVRLRDGLWNSLSMGSPTERTRREEMETA